MRSVTVAELIKLALPRATRVLAGEARLNAPVTWACVLRVSPPAFPDLEGGELAIASPERLHALNDRLTLARMVRGLTERGVAAVAICGEVNEEAVMAAQARSLPLLHLPTDTSEAAIERAVIRLIVDREAQLERFRATLAGQLTQATIAGLGWQGVAETVAQASSRNVVIQDAGFRVLAVATGAPTEPDPWHALLSPTHNEMHVWSADLEQSTDGTTHPVAVWPLEAGRGWRLIAPILAEGDVRGYLSLLASMNEFDDADRIAAFQGALAGAVELSKAQAVDDAEAGRRAAFWADLLIATEESFPRLAQRAQQWGLNLHTPLAVLMIESAHSSLLTARSRLERRAMDELKTRNLPTFVSAHGNGLVMLLKSDATRSRTLAATLLDALQTAEKATRLVGGLSRPGVGLAGLQRGIQEAEQALALAHRLGDCPPLLAFADLGIYRLLLPMSESPTLRSFHQEILGPLLAYDARQGSELVRTLEIWLQHHGNLSQAAATLHLHRNTMAYRLERIKAITGLDLQNADDRLLLHIALKIDAIL
ncbi:MAG TPA: PucR family transcriptional regulator [Anaerolineae bacterium]|nr:PucR family transcriptional regulator [Anaerolineae bacterium]HIQ04582.1 PucR family transcriptional regulator [Anaerolineae bacterium]